MMTDKEFEKYVAEMDKIKIDFISDYNHEIQGLIGWEKHRGDYHNIYLL